MPETEELRTCGELLLSIAVLTSLSIFFVACRPPLTVPETEELRAWSKRMALAAPATFFKPQPLKTRS